MTILYKTVNIVLCAENEQKMYQLHEKRSHTVITMCVDFKNRLLDHSMIHRDDLSLKTVEYRVCNYSRFPQNTQKKAMFVLLPTLTSHVFAIFLLYWYIIMLVCM